MHPFEMDIQINFVIGKLNDEEFAALQNGVSVISKIIVSPDDRKLFRYKTGDRIQVETDAGNRLWCIIKELEMLEGNDDLLAIFTLVQAPN